jgi:hypothetical protein
MKKKEPGLNLLLYVRFTSTFSKKLETKQVSILKVQAYNTGDIEEEYRSHLYFRAEKEKSAL